MYKYQILLQHLLLHMFYVYFCISTLQIYNLIHVFCHIAQTRHFYRSIIRMLNGFLTWALFWNQNLLRIFICTTFFAGIFFNKYKNNREATTLGTLGTLRTNLFLWISLMSLNVLLLQSLRNRFLSPRLVCTRLQISTEFMLIYVSITTTVFCKIAFV